MKLFISYAREDSEWVKHYLYEPLLKCTLPDGLTFYMLKKKAKIENQGRESWLNDDGLFLDTEIDGNHRTNIKLHLKYRF